MSKWALLRDDGSVAQQISTRGGAKPCPMRDNPEGLRFVAIDRFGRPGERLDAQGRWHTHAGDASDAIDAAHCADHGPFALALEHAVKAVEARFILGTLESDGLIAREAEATGRDVRELAGEIAARGREGIFEQAIVDRRRRKSDVRKGEQRGG
jgi:hypothetical protein